MDEAHESKRRYSERTMHDSQPLKKIVRSELFGIPVAAIDIDEAQQLIADCIDRRQPLQIGVVNAAKVVNMHRDADLRDSVLSSDVIFADGAAIVWASRLLGRPLPGRVAGIDLMFRMLELADRHHYRVYLLGATSAVLDRVRQNIVADYPGAVIAGAHHGYFDGTEEQAIAEDIKQSRPDILLVAMTSPKKEHFLARWNDLIDVPICHGVGGSFDVYAGLVKRAPLLWQRLGFEWLYRVLQEPRRLWKRYLVTNTLFLVLTARHLLRRQG